MKFLIIGGAGYIGSHVTKAVLDAGHQAVVLDDLSTGYKENIDVRASFIQGSIFDVKDEWFATDVVVHLAALKAAGESMERPDIYAHHNITGSINVANACMRNKVKTLVFSSSAAVYGNPQYTPMDEKHPTKPENFYGFTKLACERIFSWDAQLKDINVVNLRYFNAAGFAPDGTIRGKEKKPANLLPIVLEVANGTREKLQIFGDTYDTHDGTCIRDYVHVSDLAAAHVKAGELGKSLTVNLGTGKGYSVKEVVATAAEVTGKQIPFDIVEPRKGDPGTVTASGDLAQQELSWSAQYDLKDMLTHMWAIYK